MSQVDVLTFSSVLFWAIVSLVLLYFLIFSYIIPCILATFNVRLFVTRNRIVLLKKYHWFYVSLCEFLVSFNPSYLGDFTNELVSNMVFFRFMHSLCLFLGIGIFNNSHIERVRRTNWRKNYYKVVVKRDS
jgi:uncharacterized membrane protein